MRESLEALEEENAGLRKSLAEEKASKLALESQLEEARESASLKITCLDHLQEVLAESKRQNQQLRQEALQIKQERDCAITQMMQLQQINLLESKSTLNDREKLDDSSSDCNESGKGVESDPEADENQDYFNRWVS